MRSYAPDRLFDRGGRLIASLRALAPEGPRRMGANPHANGGALSRPLDLPAFTDYAIDVPAPGAVHRESTRALGELLRDIYRRNPTSFRLMCPDETKSNRLGAVFEAENRCFEEPALAIDDHVSSEGRVMEVLSEHNCQGWLEGYVLTGRHGLFATYEAFALIVASMATQHSKWLEATAALPWRAPVPSLNYLLTSTCWRNDHNGFSHQGPGFMDTIISKKGTVARVYLPPDGNCLLSVADHCLRSKNYVNLVIIDKQPQLQWLAMAAAREHCARGVSIWDWAGTEVASEAEAGAKADTEPDVVLACAGDTPTLETVAAAAWLRSPRPRAARAGGQRRRPDAAVLAARAPARHARRAVRRAVHARRRRLLLVPRLPRRDPPAAPRPAQRRAVPRPRLQGGGHHHHAVRHGRAQRDQPLPHRDRRAPPRAPPAGRRRRAHRGVPAPPRPAPRPRRRPVRRSPRDPRLDLDRVTAMAAVLVLNGGSSSLKYAVFDGEREIEREIERATVDGVADPRAAVARVLDRLAIRPAAVGHRLVHGGPDHVAPARVDGALLAALRGLVPLSPLHLPAELAAIDAVAERLPGVPQVACFDTAFHRTLPEVARRFALPAALAGAGVRRYGFHGLSYASIVAALPPERLRRAVIAHLGSGASMAAIRDGRSVETTMGFSPTGGLVMATRPGDLDPGVLLYLLDHSPDHRYDARRLEQLIHREAGLVALSETTGDMRRLLELRATDPRAALAIDAFCYHARKAIGALAAVLGGVETLVFTGGIGERAPAIRAEICQGLDHLGIALDAAGNAAGAPIISTGRCEVRVMRTDEEREIARATRDVLGLPGAGRADPRTRGRSRRARPRVRRITTGARVERSAPQRAPAAMRARPVMRFVPRTERAPRAVLREECQDGCNSTERARIARMIACVTASARDCSGRHLVGPSPSVTRQRPPGCAPVAWRLLRCLPNQSTADRAGRPGARGR